MRATHESGAAKGVETPAVAEGRVKGGNETGDDHDLVGDGDKDDLGDRQAGKEGQVK